MTIDWILGSQRCQSLQLVESQNAKRSVFAQKKALVGLVKNIIFRSIPLLSPLLSHYPSLPPLLSPWNDYYPTIIPLVSHYLSPALSPSLSYLTLTPGLSFLQNFNSLTLEILALLPFGVGDGVPGRMVRGRTRGMDLDAIFGYILYYICIILYFIYLYYIYIHIILYSICIILFYLYYILFILNHICIILYYIYIILYLYYIIFIFIFYYTILYLYLYYIIFIFILHYIYIYIILYLLYYICIILY